MTETFQRRARTLVEYSNAIAAAPRLPAQEAVAQLRRLGATLLDTPGVPQELLIDVMLSYRDVEAHDDLIALADRLQPEAAKHPAVQQLIAFSLNRRLRPGDDDRAVSILEELIERHGADPETLGLLGRVHKDRYSRLRDADAELAEVALDAAIEAYERGFKADLRDYYPGVNAVTLLIVKGGDEAVARARQLSPVVAFAVAARQGIQSRDYWDVATVLELAVVNADERTARRALQRLLYLGRPSWCLATVAGNLSTLQQALSRRGEQVDWLEAALGRRLRGGIPRDL